MPSRNVFRSTNEIGIFFNGYSFAVTRVNTNESCVCKKQFYLAMTQTTSRKTNLTIPTILITKMRKKNCFVWVVKFLHEGKYNIEKINMVGFEQVQYLIKQFHVFFSVSLTSLSLELFWWVKQKSCHTSLELGMCKLFTEYVIGKQKM